MNRKKIDIARMVIAFIIVLLLIFPIDTAGIETTKLFINESIVVDIKYIIIGILFMLASLSNLIYFIKKDQTDNTMTNVSNKVLINSVLIILASQGFIQPIIPVIIIIRDTIIDGLMLSKEISLIEKIKNIILMVGITLTLFYNLPFELWNLRITDFLLIVATTLSLISAFEYNTKKTKK